ncbi:MAG: enoyl-CoA hydratase/isomerase family protein [Nitrososphaerota archaeon]|jgi:enoyl-CoA hydratase|nr:enoyl-CoA hydratase/isomerase family protein [Nitrososphaerota archaeon]MDG6919791.1 enoyl-CoA hydratase/isomerase family protein [Nitrososphaerota archaeon]MDG6969438.1 enoyl-CoA hydratase/isomerase family protein [Nitrososphaerota archaeon]MDG6973053.1 enoyl-CoA hydratase/isomerase family protein [Nitrososphaerota archaeon]MDG6976947.1 enoyl-CoA hydratase/isomerase family protein [Nitrososphaerota archaeon]
MPSANSVVLLDIHDGYAEITFNRPERLNAFNDEMRAKTREHLAACIEDDSVHAVVLKGEGRAFSAGADLGNPSTEIKPTSAWKRLFLSENRLFKKVLSCPKPTIAATKGYALGYGFFLANSCDVILSTRSCKFGTPEIRQAAGVARLLAPSNVRRNLAMEFLLTGDLVDGEKAEAIGLVNRAVEDDALDREVSKLARKLGRIDLRALRMNKAMVNRWYGAERYWLPLDFAARQEALLLGSGASVEWMKLAQKVGLKEFLRLRDEPFREIEEGGERDESPAR